MLKEVTEGTGILVEHVRRNIFPETECKQKIGNCHFAASEVEEELFLGGALGTLECPSTWVCWSVPW